MFAKTEISCENAKRDLTILVLYGILVIERN